MLSILSFVQNSGVILYISLWYPRHISQSRVAFFFGAATLAGAFSGLLACKLRSFSFRMQILS